ncbi:DUF2931 family protein [Xenorhabdus eapokensis]|uniref:DUF2931 family protein n=1 Tax=Xenorhabdus eapokensis TaxID=1873482 RepID=A0A1Q5TIR4_9GAMM|nr:DUF2931 family protein [Xenorhabdus eapokensis]OKP00120.1 hypothetical protein Xedl_03439 [Xenorhabdus eapokensis]
MRHKKALVLLLGLSVIVGLTACQSYLPGKRVVTYKPIVRHSEPLPYDKWWFKVRTPKYFPASVSFVQFQDEDNYLVQKFMPDGASSDFESVNSWNKRLWGSSGIRNYGEALPRSLTICWDSVIDKKSYQTTFKFTSEVWQLMREPAFYPGYEKQPPDYRKVIYIGLAPSGIARAWLNGIDKNNGDNILIATGKSVSGDNMTVCQDKTNYPDGYAEYSKRIKDFIKGKKYPYGEW